MIEYIVGDVTNIINQKSITLIPHCCNNIGAMGSGVAKAIIDKWPKVWDNYAANSNHLYLGRTDFIKVEDKVIVVNMLGQEGIKSGVNKDGIAIGHDGKPPVRYSALCKAMFNIRNFIVNGLIEEKGHKDIIIQCPLFGCDLAGGKWEFVSALIEEILCPTQHTKVICVVHKSSLDKFGYLLK